MAEPIEMTDDELLKSRYSHLLDMEPVEPPEEFVPEADAVPEDVVEDAESDYGETILFKPIPPQVTGMDVDLVVLDYRKAVTDFHNFTRPGTSDEEKERLTEDEMGLALQYPLYNAIPFDRPSVSQIKKAIENKPYLRDVAKAIPKLYDIITAIDQDDDDSALELIEQAPMSTFPESILFPASIPGMVGRALGTRLTPVRPEGQRSDKKPFEVRHEIWQAAEKKYRKALKGDETIVDHVRNAWAGDTKMTLEEAQQMGMMRGGQDQSFWRPEELWEGGPMVAGGAIELSSRFRDFISRGAAIGGVYEYVFAPLFLKGKDLERFKKEMRAAEPTEAMEHIALSVRLARERGESEASIKSKLNEELGRSLLSLSYSDLPEEAQFEEPSLQDATSFVKRNVSGINKSDNAQLKRFMNMVLADEEEEDLQRMLNTVSFGQLPSNVYSETIPSTKKVADKIVNSVDYIIGAQNASGYQGTLSLERSLGNAMLSTEVVDGKVQIVEGQVARWMSLLGALTDTVAEARLPYDIPITPASRDFYYKFGKRSPDSTWLSRLLANIETRDLGFTRHLTDEALMRGQDRGSPWYHMAAILGLGADFLVPWEKGQLKIASAPVRFGYRGSKTLRQFPVKGYRNQAFLAGAAPRVYQLLYKSGKRAKMASDRLTARFEGIPTVEQLREATLRTGDNAITYEEVWIGDQIVQLMGREKTPLSYEKAVEQIKLGTATAPWENLADTVETYLRNMMDTPDGQNIYENLPPKLRGTVRRLLDTVADSRDVERQLGQHFSESGKLHVALLDIMRKNGDPETVVIRMSDEYKRVQREVSELVADGTISAEEYTPIMGYLETQAIRATLSGEKYLADFKLPEDFFANLSVNRLNPAETGGLRWDIQAQGPVVKKAQRKRFDGLSINSSQSRELLDFLKDGDVERLFKSQDAEWPIFRSLMGDRTVNSLYRQFDHVVRKGPDGVDRPYLTDLGKTQLTRTINDYFSGGEGSVGSVARFFTDFQSRFGVLWTRVSAEADTIGTRLEVKDMFNKMFDPNGLLKNDAIAMQIAGKSAKRVARPAKTVRIKTGVEGLREGQVPAVGRQKEFWDVDFQPENVRHALGITDQTQEISAAELFARAVGYAVGEHFKRTVGSTKLVKLTERSFVTPEQLVSISKVIKARVAKVLGTTQDTVFNEKATMTVGGETITGVYVLNDIQQGRMRVFLRQLANEPMGKIIYERVLGVDADLSKISRDEFMSIRDAMRDIEAGVFNKVTHYSMEIPESLGKALWMTIRDNVDRAAGGSAFIAKWRSQIKKVFEVPDDLKNVIGPAQRQVVEKHMARLEQAGQDVFGWAQEAMRGNKEITMDMMFEQLRTHLTPPVRLNKVDAIMGHVIKYPKLTEDMDVSQVPAKKGYLDILTEFTDAEKTRHSDYTIAQREAGEGMFVEPRPPDILVGKGEEITADSYAMAVDEAGSKLEFLLRDTTIAEMQTIVQNSERGIDSLTDELTEAFNILETYRNADLAKLGNQDRMVIGSSIERIRDAMEVQKHQIVVRGEKIAIGLAGEPDASILTNLPDQVKAKLYKDFYRGGEGWKEMAAWLQQTKGRETGVETVVGKRLPRYRMTEAFLGLMVRMRAYEIMHDLADDMVRYGMPGDLKKFSKPRAIISRTGEIVASPIDTENLFWKRVKFYVEQELNFSMTRVEERLYKLEPAENEDALAAKRAISPQAPTRDLYPEVMPERFNRAQKGGVLGTPHDFEAYTTAQEIIARYGHRYRPDNFEITRLPSGQQTLMPKQLVSEIEGAIDRASQIGTARAGVVPELRSDIIGSPIGIDPIVSRKRTFESNALRAVDFFALHFPVTMKHMKMGMTSGLMVPNPAYFFGVGMGGMLQMYQGMGPVGTARSIFKHNGITSAVVARMWKDGDFAPGNPILVAVDGSVYTADQITELALAYGLKSSFIYSEAPQTLAKNMNRLRAKGINKVYWTADEWQRTLIESATAMDNYYRVSVFVDALNRGESAASAARLARKVAFDYSDLTDIEKSWFRNIFMFYSYMRKNMDLFWDTILTNPERVTGQLRVMKGIQNAYIEEDTEVRLFERDYAKTRMIVAFKNAAANQHAVDKWMYITPPIPAYDALGLISELFMALGGDPDAQRYMATQVNPWIQLLPVMAAQKDFFYNKDINRYNQVPPILMHLDQTILGGVVKDIFDIVPNQNLDLSRRYVEGEEYRGYWQANNGKLWWIWRNMIQVPMAGRSMDTFSYLDRANLGPIELMADVSRSIHEYGVTVGAWERNKDLSPTYNEQMGPRTGLTWTDELLGLLGIKPFPIPTSQAAHQKMLTRWAMALGKKRFEKERVDPQKTFGRRKPTSDIPSNPNK